MKRWSARAGRARLRADHRRRRQHVVQRHRLEPHVGVPLEPAASPQPRSPPNTPGRTPGALRRLYAWLGRPRARGRDPRRLLRLRAARESATIRLRGGAKARALHPPAAAAKADAARGSGRRAKRGRVVAFAGRARFTGVNSGVGERTRRGQANCEAGPLRGETFQGCPRGRPPPTS